MADLDKLRDEHTVILRLVERLRFLVDLPKPPPQLHLFTLRHELSATLVGHLKTEDWALYPLLRASPDPHIASLAREFSAEMGGMAAAYRDHCERWNATAITSDWRGYGRDCRALLTLLTTRISRENHELYPLLERLARAA
jgi:hypothetical protein